MNKFPIATKDGLLVCIPLTRSPKPKIILSEGRTGMSAMAERAEDYYKLKIRG